MVQTSRLTPGMVRIVVEGSDLEDFPVGEHTDHYVKCRFGDKTRSYTVRDYDAASRRLTLDFVVHGDDGAGRSMGGHGHARRHAAAERPGRRLRALGGRRLAPDGRR